MAVVAVAGFNTYLANDIRVQRNELSLLNLENIAEGQEQSPIENGNVGKGYEDISYYSEDFQDWVYVNGCKTRRSGTRTWKCTDCIGNEPSNCQPGWVLNHVVWH